MYIRQIKFKFYHYEYGGQVNVVHNNIKLIKCVCNLNAILMKFINDIILSLTCMCVHVYTGYVSIWPE